MSSTTILRIAGWFGICVVIVLSIIPADVQVRTGASKGLEHVTAYFLLGLVLFKAYGGLKNSAPCIAVLLIALSGALEIAQAWSPGRTPLVADWLNGAAGATIAMLVYLALTRLWHSHVAGQLRSTLVPANLPPHRQHVNAASQVRADDQRSV